MSAVKFSVRPSEKRGNANHGWLRSWHTFSFADYYDPKYQNYGALRVINEDRVAPATGFPTHPHREAEIFSYIVSGELAHKDTMGNVESMKRGQIQMTSGGSGIAHSEFNADRNPDGKDAHFLQIWALPYERNLKPQYYAREFSDEEKKDKWAHIVAPAKSTEFGVIDKRDASGPTPIHSAVNTFATLLSPAATVDHALVSRLVPDATNVKKVYLQVVQTTAYNPNAAVKDGAVAALVKVSLGGQEATLGEGDGVFIDGATVGENLVLENVSSKVAEVLLFEMD